VILAPTFAPTNIDVTAFFCHARTLPRRCRLQLHCWLSYGGYPAL